MFNGKRHPKDLGAKEVEAFLTHLAVDGQVSASTQNQALSALLFLYKEVLLIDLPWLDNVVRAKHMIMMRMVNLDGNTNFNGASRRLNVLVILTGRRIVGLLIQH